MNNINDIDLNLLKLLGLIYETKSLTRAGQHLGLTQSAVSHSLKKLRASFDDQLVIRQGNKLRLTARSETLRPALEAWLNDFQRTILNPEEFDPKKSKRSFTIATTDLTEQMHLPRLAKIFSKDAPGIRLQVIKWDIYNFTQQLNTGDIDFGIGVSKTTESNIMSRTLYNENFCSMVRRGHPILKSKDKLKSFVEYPHVLSSTGRGGKGVVDLNLERLGMKRDLLYRLSNFSSAPFFVENSDTILTAPKRFLNFISKRYNVELFETPIDLPVYNLKMFWHEKNQGEKASIWLREQIYKVSNTPL